VCCAAAKPRVNAEKPLFFINAQDKKGKKNKQINKDSTFKKETYMRENNASEVRFLRVQARGSDMIAE
jgi:hypothetical protein